MLHSLCPLITDHRKKQTGSPALYSPRQSDWRKTVHISQNSFHTPFLIDLSHTIHKLMSHTDLLIEAAGGTTRLLPLLRLKRLNENKRGDRDGDAPSLTPPGYSWIVTPHSPIVCLFYAWGLQYISSFSNSSQTYHDFRWNILNVNLAI